jgi:RNA polymerase sigma-70 factor, ECF subfamily
VSGHSTSQPSLSVPFIMRWNARPNHETGRSIPEQGSMRPVPGLGGVDSSGEVLARIGFGGAGLGNGSNLPMAAQFSGKSDEGTRGSHARSGGGDDFADRPDSVTESADSAQPSTGDRVPEDMATMVLDNPALGAATQGAQQNARVMPNYGADESSDAAIMLRVAAGDDSGFNYLVEKYHRAMIHFLFRMVRSQAVAEELAQEVFLRVYRSRESYRAEAKFTTWLYRIATNLAVNHARDTKHERAAQTVYLDAPDEETGTTPDVADDEPSVEQRLLRDERMAAIRKHVMALPERQRMAVLMHKYQGMDYKQIGEVLKLSESATKSLLFRAYQTLRDKLKDFV